jgi:putative flippase GtrA
MKVALEPSGTLLQLCRYSMVGGVAFTIDISTLYLMTRWLHVYYLASAAGAFVLGLIVNYVLSINYVFDRRTIHNKYAEFSLFAVIGIVGLGFNEAFLYLFTGLLGVHYLFSKALTAGLGYTWNFFARKYTLFL